MSEKKLLITDVCGQIIFFSKVTSLQISDKLIIDKSIQFFNDDAPCFIHRSAVMKRLFTEIEDYLEKRATNDESIKIDDLPENVSLILSAYKKIKTVQYI